MEKIEALAKHLDVSTDDLTQSKYDENTFELGNQEYLVLTDEEADEKAAEYIRDSIWAFNPEFLAAYMPKGVEADTIKIIQEKCEDANEPLLGMIQHENGLINELIKDAIGADGRGHFLNTYDSSENEEDRYFIYRIN